MSDLIIRKKFAEIKEVRIEGENDNLLRVYCSQHPDVFTFQIRTHKPITEYGNGKPRNMIADVSLTISEMESILAYMKSKPYG